MPIYDITQPIEASLAEWPGDTPFLLNRMLKIEEGSSVNLGSVSMSLHTGTHADAPRHFTQTGAAIEQVPLEVYCGQALVVEVTGVETISIPHLQEQIDHWAPRLIIKTSAWLNRTVFPAGIPVLQQDVPQYLKQKGVCLLGVDVPSVDSLESRELPIHHALHQNGIAILESLQLQGIEPGRYELIALPLPFAGADASPVRAILRR